MSSKMDEIVATPIFPSMMFTQNSIKKLANKFPWHETVDVKNPAPVNIVNIPHYVERGGL